MEPIAIAALLRVDISTVAVYVLQAIKIEHFQFGKKRARMLVPLAPRSLRDYYESMISDRLKKPNDGTGEKGQKDPALAGTGSLGVDSNVCDSSDR